MMCVVQAGLFVPRLPSLREVNVDRLKETQGCMWHVVTTMKEDVFEELLDYLP